MEKSVGIVLKTYQPKKQTLVILDKHAGKITAVPHRPDIAHGSLLAYTRREHDKLYFIHGIDILDMPMVLAQEDIIFVHHVLEMCYYFIPHASQAPHVFDALLRFYQMPIVLNTYLLKKIFIAKIFFLLGVHPDFACDTPAIRTLASTSIDFLASESLDLSIEQELDAWLLACIQTHPCARYFKTTNFLVKNKVI